jgi:hypothetical protein
MAIPALAGVVMVISYNAVFWLIFACFIIAMLIYGVILYLVRQRTSSHRDFELLNES